MKTVLVTGGTVRLGAAIAERLRAEGWRVLTSSHRADAGADLVADLAEPMGPAKLYAAAMKFLGGNPPDALVNNAALFTGDAAAIAAVNLESPKKLTMLMAGREAGVGTVVNILDSVVLGSLGSVGSKATLRDPNPALSDPNPALSDSNPTLSDPNPALSDSNPALSDSNPALSDPKRPYLASKRALLDFTRSAAATFATTLRVNGVAPGPVLAPTDVHVKAGETLLDRRPTADDVAAAVSYLLGAESTTGVVIPVDAGQHLIR